MLKHQETGKFHVHLTEEDTEDTEGLKQLWSEWELVESQAPNLF